MKKKFKTPKGLFMGRFQPCSLAHSWLFEQKLNKGIPILIAIRDMEPDEKNPLKSEDVKRLWEKVYEGQDVTVIIIPDIESVNWGRLVGYETNMHTPPADIANISATQIRKEIAEGSEDWKTKVNPKIWDDVEQLLKK